MTIAIAPPRAAVVHYPESDGKPMAETDVHRKQMVALEFALQNFFRDHPQIYVASNLLIYYVEGDYTQSVAPDVFVVKGVPKGNRRTFKLWEEGRAPTVVIELTSDSTRKEDMGNKRLVYADLGVQEYFIFDPLGQYLKPPLRGYRLSAGEYAPMSGEPLFSRELGLELHVDAGQLRLYDPQQQAYLLSPDETQARAERAEAEIEKLRAELERLRGRLN